MADSVRGGNYLRRFRLGRHALTNQQQQTQAATSGLASGVVSFFRRTGGGDSGN